MASGERVHQAEETARAKALRQEGPVCWRTSEDSVAELGVWEVGGGDEIRELMGVVQII